MADMKFSADLDLKVNTDVVARDIARAIGQATSARAHAIDWAVLGLEERLKAENVYTNTRGVHLGLDSIVGPEGSIADFAAMAAGNPYRYQPSTIQAMIRNAASKAAAQHNNGKIDLQYKLDMEAATGELRRNQRQLRAAELASVYLGQGNTLLDAASFAETPEAQRILLSRAASRYGSISSRTLMEAGGVSDKAAVAALTASATVSAMRSKVKTADQEEEESRRVAEELSNLYLGNFRYNSGLFRGIRRAEEAKSAQEESAWLAREKELAYNPSQKAHETEEGFRIIEASSATEDMYNAAKDPFAQQQSVGNAIDAAAGYVRTAGSYAMGSAERRAYLRMASSSLNGITPSFMSSIGMNSREIANNSIKIEKLTDQIDALRGDAPTGGDSAFWTRLFGPAAVAGAVAYGLRTIGGIMEGRTQWLADTETPYQTRRSVLQGWAQKYGLGVAAGGALAGAKIGAAAGATAGSIVPGAGTAVGGAIGAVGGAVIGAIPGAIPYLLGTHYKDEKKIGDAWQTEAIKMARYYNLYGEGVDYNYSLAVANTGYMSRESVLQLSQTADMLPGAMAFGAVSEQEMLALSMMPNYYAALMEGRSTAEIMDSYRKDITNLPREYRQIITSLLPGVDENTRAFVSSDYYGWLSNRAGEYRGYDYAERGFIPGLESKRFEIAHENVRHAYMNASSQIPGLNEANYNSPAKAAAMAGGDYYYATPVTETKQGMMEAINSLWTGDRAHSKLGDIIIQIDGDVIHQQPYTYDDFLTGSQSYVVGG